MSESSVSKKKKKTSTVLFNFRAFLSVFKIKFCAEIFYTTDSVRGIPRLLKGSFPGGVELKVNKTVYTSCDNII